MLSRLSVVLNAVVVYFFLLCRNRFTLAIIEKSVGPFLFYFFIILAFYMSFIYIINIIIITI